MLMVIAGVQFTGVAIAYSISQFGTLEEVVNKEFVWEFRSKLLLLIIVAVWLRALAVNIDKEFANG